MRHGGAGPAAARRGQCMKRRIFNLLAALSLLLCAATVVVWVRSYWINDVVTRSRTDGFGSGVVSIVATHRGIFDLSHGTSERMPGVTLPADHANLKLRTEW